MKVIITGWKVGMKKLPLTVFLKDYVGLTSAGSLVYGLFDEAPKPIEFEISPTAREEVEEKLQDFRVQYSISG
jgi:hypothetical protein